MRHCLKKEKQINKQQNQKTGLGGEGICLRSHDELELGTRCSVLFLVGVRALSYLSSAHPVPGWVTRRSESFGSVERGTAPWGKQIPHPAEVGLLDALTPISTSPHAA